jgi:cytochrome c oxidase accessory protein FixG
MGIDIRNGSQLECINCGLCVDACDEMMDKIGRPRGLIAYDTDAAVAARSCGKPAVYKPVRPRTVYYASALALVGSLMAWGFAHRAVVDLHVLRDRNPMFVRLQDGSIRNGYTLKIANRTFHDQTYVISFSGVTPVMLKTPGAPSDADRVEVEVQANHVRAERLFVIAPPDAIQRSNTPVVFTIRNGQAVASAKSVFTSGTNR